MAVTDAQIAFVKELFEGAGAITTRKMFGGLGIYCDGTIFAMIGPEDALLIKAKDRLAEELQSLGSTQFIYDGHKDKVTTMPYWTLPDSAQDDPDEAAEWARKSLQQNA